jgi:ribosomal protein L29
MFNELSNEELLKKLTQLHVQVALQGSYKADQLDEIRRITKRVLSRMENYHG